MVFTLYWFFSGDPQNNGSNHGSENEPAPFKSAEHAEGSRTDEPIVAPEHTEIHGCLRARRTTARTD